MNYIFLIGCIFIVLEAVHFFWYVNTNPTDMPRKVRILLSVVIPLFLSLGFISFLMAILGVPLLLSGTIFVGSTVKVDALFALLTIIYLVSIGLVSIVLKFKNKKRQFSSVENME